LERFPLTTIIIIPHRRNSESLIFHSCVVKNTLNSNTPPPGSPYSRKFPSHFTANFRLAVPYRATVRSKCVPLLQQNKRHFPHKSSKHSCKTDKQTKATSPTRCLKVTISISDVFTQNLVRSQHIRPLAQSIKIPT